MKCGYHRFPTSPTVATQSLRTTMTAAMATWSECRVLSSGLTNLALRAHRVNPNETIKFFLTKHTPLTDQKPIGAELTEAVPTGEECNFDLSLTKWTILFQLILPFSTRRQHWPCLPFDNSAKKRRYRFHPDKAVYRNRYLVPGDRKFHPRLISP
jgi:hypothetical protein